MEQYPDQVQAVRLDVTNAQEAQAAVQAAVDAFGGLDVLVNNAGYGTVGAVEEFSDEVVRQQFETNLFGALNVIRAVLPVMRQQQRGHILNISSVGGFVSFPIVGIYCATKFALEALSESLAGELANTGIKVTIVEPGAFRTDFSGRSLVTAERSISEYAAVREPFVQWMESIDGKQPGDPVKAAQAMIQVVASDNPPLRLPLGADAVDMIEKKLQSVKAELDAWRDVAVNTAFEGAVVGAIGG